MKFTDVNIWYLTDNSDGENVCNTLSTIGLKAHLIKDKENNLLDLKKEEQNIVVIDYIEKELSYILEFIKKDSRLQKILKYIVLPENEINEALKQSNNMLNIEYIDRPLHKREFVLIIEKSIMVEKYRSMMKNLSRESEDRIEAYESLIHIHKKDLFTDEKEKEAFEKIMSFEKNLIDEQKNLNLALKEFTFLRQKEIFEMRSLLHANEMVGHLRHKELLDANETIKAQQAVLEYSRKEMSEISKIVEAIEITGELSREEAKELHQKVKDLMKRNNNLEVENQKLKKEIEKYNK